MGAPVEFAFGSVVRIFLICKRDKTSAIVTTLHMEDQGMSDFILVFTMSLYRYKL